MNGEQRRKFIIEILNRWGRLDRSTICNYLSKKTGEDYDSPNGNKLVLRDLNKLVENNEIFVHYFSRDESPIDDYLENQKIYKNVKCYWQIRDSKYKVFGEGFLESLNVKLYTPKLIQNDVFIHDENIEIQKSFNYIFFRDDISNFCIKIRKEAAPFSLLISGTIEPDTEVEHIKKIEDLYGIRTMFIQIPNRFVSTGKRSEKIGHLLLEFRSLENEVTIEDLGSTNGTTLITLNQFQKQILLKSHTFINENRTYTDDLLFQSNNLIPQIKIQSRENIELPTKLQIAKNIEITII
jgi:hypothetical protein